ncbi:hypothetical protein QF025_000043 [Paraburkholderia graminis]|uniref:Secreted effector protein SseD n=1 Tax=Paraburkholderia graminis TaxID=60548 RepID=A0ABD5C7S3_9BURK|nr:hypothetical protein [Paraburkholderia graminis]
MPTEVMTVTQFDAKMSTFQQKPVANPVDRVGAKVATPVGQGELSDAYMKELMSFAEIGLLIAVEFQKLRDAGRSYLSTALINEFKQLIFVLKKKNDSIDENWNAAIIKSSFEIASGAFSLATAGAGALKGGAAGMKLGTDFGASGSKIFSAAGELYAASVTKEAQQDQAEADFMSQNTDRYSKGIERLEAQMREVAEKAMQALSTFRELYERSVNSVKVA